MESYIDKIHHLISVAMLAAENKGTVITTTTPGSNKAFAFEIKCIRMSGKCVSTLNATITDSDNIHELASSIIEFYE